MCLPPGPTLILSRNWLKHFHCIHRNKMESIHRVSAWRTMNLTHQGLSCLTMMDVKVRVRSDKELHLFFLLSISQCKPHLKSDSVLSWFLLSCPNVLPQMPFFLPKAMQREFIFSNWSLDWDSEDRGCGARDRWWGGVLWTGSTCSEAGVTLKLRELLPSPLAPPTNRRCLPKNRYCSFHGFHRQAPVSERRFVYHPLPNQTTLK